MANVKKPSTKGLIFIAVAAVGFILAIVGLFLDAVSSYAEMLGQKISLGIGLFDLGGSGASFPGELVMVFGIVTLVLALASCVLVVLKSIGILNLKNVVMFAIGGLTVLCAVLTIVFGFVFVGSLNNTIPEGIEGIGYAIEAGPILTAIGGVLAGVPLFLVKDNAEAAPVNEG